MRSGGEGRGEKYGRGRGRGQGGREGGGRRGNRDEGDAPAALGDQGCASDLPPAKSQGGAHGGCGLVSGGEKQREGKDFRERRKWEKRGRASYDARGKFDIIHHLPTPMQFSALPFPPSHPRCRSEGDLIQIFPLSYVRKSAPSLLRAFLLQYSLGMRGGLGSSEGGEDGNQDSEEGD